MPISLGIGTAVTRGGGLPWSPLSISGLQFWVDAADSATLYTDSALTTLAVVDGDVVGGWKDKSGNSRNILQTDGTKKPLLKTAVYNGRNTVRFDGVNDLLTSSLSVSYGLFTLFSVYKLPSTSGGDLVIFTLTDNSYSGLAVYVKSSLFYAGHNTNVGRVSDTSIVLNQITTQRTTLTGPGCYASRINGTTRTLTSIASGTDSVLSRPVSLGGYPAGGYPTLIDNCEQLFYDSVLSNSDILLVEAYLKTKWGTP